MCICLSETRYTAAPVENCIPVLKCKILFLSLERVNYPFREDTADITEHSIGRAGRVLTSLLILQEMGKEVKRRHCLKALHFSMPHPDFSSGKRRKI